MQRLIYGFIYNRDKPGGPAAYFSDISIPGNVAKVFIHTLNVRFLSPTGRPWADFFYNFVACAVGCW